MKIKHAVLFCEAEIITGAQSKSSTFLNGFMCKCPKIYIEKLLYFRKYI
jgi:hypothetical protein